LIGGGGKFWGVNKSLSGEKESIELGRDTFGFNRGAKLIPMTDT